MLYYIDLTLISLDWCGCAHQFLNLIFNFFIYFLTMVAPRVYGHYSKIEDIVYNISFILKSRAA
jgi:hypothetical protein